MNLHTVSLKINCAVPENIHTPTTEGIGNSGGVGGSKAQENPEERGVKRINYFPEGQLRFIPMYAADKVRKLLLTEFVDLYCGIKLV